MYKFAKEKYIDGLFTKDLTDEELDRVRKSVNDEYDKRQKERRVNLKKEINKKGYISSYEDL